MRRHTPMDVDDHEAPALASTPHHSPLPASHGAEERTRPPRACLRGSQHKRLRRYARSCVLSSELLEPKWPSVVQVAEHRGRPHFSTLPAEAPKALRTGTPETNTLGKSTGGCHGTERCCSRIGRRIAVVRRQDSREVPLHDPSCDLPQDQPMPVAGSSNCVRKIRRKARN